MQNASCECPAGAAGHCKHICAVYYYVNNEHVLSKTDKPCEWKNPAAHSKEKYTKAKTFAELFPKKCQTKVDSKIFSVYSILDTDIECDLKTVLFEERKTDAERFMSSYLNELLINVFKRINSNKNTAVLRHINCNVIYDYSIKYTLSVDELLFYNTHVNLSTSELDSIFQNTIEQSLSKRWHSERHLRISASSKAHKIKTLTRKDSCKLAEELLNPPKLVGRAASNANYGISSESKARNLYEKC